jgi:hypothetical protein
MSDREFPYGLTVDRGRYRLVTLLRGSPSDGLWLAEAPASGYVLVTLRRIRFTRELDALLRYSAPGISAPRYIGPPDLFDEDGADIQQQHTAVVDDEPAGVELASAGRLSVRDTAALGIGLCDALVGWAAACGGTITRGLRPETVFVADDAGGRRFTGAIPRTFFLLGNDGMNPPFPRVSFDPPAPSAFELSPSDGLFTVAMILWFASTGVHPYAIAGTSVEDNVWEDRRVEFVGPEPLGDVLRAALVADPDARIAIDRFREQLRVLEAP